MQHHRWKAALVAVALGLSGVVAACGDDEEESGGDAAPRPAAASPTT